MKYARAKPDADESFQIVISRAGNHCNRIFLPVLISVLASISAFVPLLFTVMFSPHIGIGIFLVAISVFIFLIAFVRMIYLDRANLVRALIVAAISTLLYLIFAIALSGYVEHRMKG